MKIFIMVDMEGISGVTDPSQVSPSKPEYSEGRRYTTWEVNACVQGCLDGGATQIVVRDAHYAGRNLIWEELSPHAEYVIGKSGEERFPGIDEFDGFILLGYHAMAGTRAAILEHTMSSAGWQNFWVNGKLCGEIGIEAGLLGCHGKPVIMVSGDDKTCTEAQQFIPGVVTAQVKTGLSVNGGQLLSKEAAHKLVREKAAEAVKKCRQIKPYQLEGPVTLKLEVVSRQSLPSTLNKPYLKILDGRTYEVVGDNFEEAWGRML